MNRTEAIERINAQPERYLKKDKSGKGYICPICNSGNGPKGTGLRKYNGRYKCFACGEYGDIIDFIQKAEHINEWNDAFKKACEIYGIDYTQHTEHTHNTHNTQLEDEKAYKEKERIRADIERAKNNIEAPEALSYLEARCISLDTAQRFNLGFIKEWTHPKTAGKAYPSPRLIIPTGPESYLARDIRINLTDEQNKYSKQKVGPSTLFNPEALEAGEPCFIVEGEIDALSVAEVGFNAVALGSVSNIELLIDRLKDIKKPAPLILYLDNDKAGRDADATLQARLKERGNMYTSITGKDIYKDANDSLKAFSKETLKADLEKALNEIRQKCDEERQEYIRANNALAHLDKFIEGIKYSVDTPFIPTGFSELDRILDGGLYEGLYILGAISSLGKTTFLLQVADQIAKKGTDVLFFSLEMARTELMAKSISRETALYCTENKISTSNAKSIRGITVASRYAGYSDTEKSVINEAIERYKKTAKKLFIYEGLADIGVAEIKSTVEKHIEATGNKPVVFIDYLQILAQQSDNRSRTDKQIADYNVTALKRLGRALKLPIVAISSFNRENYTTSVNMASFKESGAIEYSSDVLIGLQFKDTDNQKQSDSGKADFRKFIENEKQKNPREVELKILKNRNGVTDKKAFYKYYPIFNLYNEDSTGSEKEYLAQTHGY